MWKIQLNTILNWIQFNVLQKLYLPSFCIFYPQMYILTFYTGCIILSTWILTFFVIYSGFITALMSIDSMINVWCLVLCDKRYDKIYRTIFKCMAKGDVLDEYLAKNCGKRSIDIRYKRSSAASDWNKKEKSSTTKSSTKSSNSKASCKHQISEINLAIIIDESAKPEPVSPCSLSNSP